MSWFKKKTQKIKSVTMQLAVKCGFMTSEQACEADQTFSANGCDEHPTLEFLSEGGYLTPEQAEHVRTRRLEEHPSEAVKENLKTARRVQKQMEQTGTIRLAEVLKARGG